jgi:2',3'-cyclic-nucleotide 2'-phosphodiesterase
MKILFIGDIFGRPGREAVTRELPKLRDEHEVDLVIANGENVSNGRGLLPEHYQELRKAGVDLFTAGNHIFAQKATADLLENKGERVLRPANYPPGVLGRGSQIVAARNGKKVAVLNLMGRVFMKEDLDDPFRAAELWLEDSEVQVADVRIIDFHAEATSEKVCLAYFLDGRVSAVLGTHTHVATADARVLPKGTGFQSDVGMTGPLHSSLGVNVENVIESFLTQRPFKHEVAEGPVVWNSTLVEVENGLCKAITPISKVIG